MKINLTFDGGAAPNPGKAYGSFLAEGNGPNNLKFEVRGKRIQFGDRLTNNQAEWLALITGLKQVLVALNGEHYGQPFGGPRAIHLMLRSDSRLVILQLRRRYKCKVAHLLELREAADKLLEEFGGWHAEWHPRRKSVALFGH